MSRSEPRASLRVALGLAAVLIGAPTVAHASPPDAPGTSGAASPEHETALRTGLDEYGRGNYVAAIRTWESLLATIGEERGYKVLYNLGLAYQQIGDVTHAIERYRSFVQRVAGRPYPARDLVQRSEDATRRLAELEGAHGAVLVKPPARGGVVLTRVGTAEPRAAGYVVWLAPGPHSVELFVGTAQAKTVRVEVVRGATLSVETTPPEAAPSPGVPEAAPRAQAPIAQETRAMPPAAGGSSRTTWLVAGSVATAASFALPVALLVVAGNERDDAEALGAGHTGYAAARASYESTRTAYHVSYALPGALAVATAIVWATRPSAPASPSVGVALGPSGAVFRGSF